MTSPEASCSVVSVHCTRTAVVRCLLYCRRRMRGMNTRMTSPATSCTVQLLDGYCRRRVRGMTTRTTSPATSCTAQCTVVRWLLQEEERYDHQDDQPSYQLYCSACLQQGCVEPLSPLLSRPAHNNIIHEKDKENCTQKNNRRYVRNPCTALFFQIEKI